MKMEKTYAREFAEIYDRLDGALTHIIEAEKEHRENNRWMRNYDSSQLFKDVEKIVKEHHPHLLEAGLGVMSIVTYVLEHLPKPQRELMLGYSETRRPILSEAGA